MVGWVRSGNRRRYHYFKWFVPGVGWNSLCGMKWVKDEDVKFGIKWPEEGACKKCYEIERKS